jgi:hypothetical protein
MGPPYSSSDVMYLKPSQLTLYRNVIGSRTHIAFYEWSVIPIRVPESLRMSDHS